MNPPTQERPKSLPSASQRIDTGVGKVYVEITYTEGDPYDGGANALEVFVRRGKSGGMTKTFTEAIGMLASIALRSGVDAEEIALQLQGIRGPRIADDNGDTVLSIPDAVGIAIERHLTGRVGESVRDETPGVDEVVV